MGNPRASFRSAYGNTDRWPEAREALQRAVALRGDDAEAHYRLGRALTKLGRPREAREEYARAVQLQPAHEAAQLNLGLACVDLGLREEAIEAFRRAVRLRPDRAPARFNLALALLAAGDPAGARAEQRVLEDLDPNLAAQLRMRLVEARP